VNPSAGSIIPSEGSTRVRVRYAECDPMNVAHHASYAPWLEIARTELLRAGGISYASLEASGVLLVVVHLEIRYRRPVRYDDVIQIHARVVGGSRVKIEHEYEIQVVERGGATIDEHAAVASTTLACIGRDGRPRPLPDWLRPSDPVAAEPQTRP
jgi:acyl-CoA thioester hydrolase